MNLNQLLAQMVERKATVLHLVGGSPPLVKPVGGGLMPLVNEPLSVMDVKSLIEEALTQEQREHLAQSKELSSAHSVEGLSRFRASVFYQRGSLAAVFRLTPPNPPSLEELGIPPVLKDVAVKPQGLILIVGPKGSGKSQTLAALLDHLLTHHSLSIVSIENPIEFLFRNRKGVVYQREVGTDTQGVKQALETALRQNPDILALTELPDFETVMRVVSAASSGQMVIATLTANGIIMAIEQLIEQAPPHLQATLRSQLGAAFEFGLGQLLLNKKGGGLILATEIMLGTPAVKGIIREGKIMQLLTAINNGRDIGMMTQELSLKNLSRRNLIESEEAIGKAARPEDLKRLLSLPI